MKLKMKKLILLLFTALFVFTINGLSQSYEVIYLNCNQEVKSKIDQNKIDAINILDGIKSVQIIGISGLGLSQSINIEKQLSSKTDVISFVLNEDNTSISIVSLPSFTKDSFKEILDSFQAVITGYSVKFVIEE
ncbi:MAG: hypothetical protein RI883_590 [Bacteroidota bacterium]|jgi:hypothetical protein